MRNISERLREDFKFIRGWVRDPSGVGAVKPTGKIAARHMASVIPIETGLPVLELGAGTGVISAEILKRGLPAEKLVSLEYSEEFYDYLSRKFPGVTLIQGDALDLDTALKDVPFDVYAGVIGAIPLLNLGKDERVNLIEQSLKRVSGDGPFVQICYGPNPPVKAIPGKFSVEKSDQIYRNFPPAAIWIYRKDIQ